MWDSHLYGASYELSEIFSRQILMFPYSNQNPNILVACLFELDDDEHHR